MASATSNNSYHPITGLFRDMQKSVLPDEMKDNIASRWIEVISDATKHEGDGVDDWLIREVGSRLAAAAMPIFVALATVQLAGVLVCQVTLMALGQEHDDIDKCTTDLLRMIGALFTSVIAWPWSIIDPTVYQRDERSSPPAPDLEAENKSLVKQVQDLNEALIEAQRSPSPLLKASSWDQLCYQSRNTPGADPHKYEYSSDDLVDPTSTWQANGAGINGTSTDHIIPNLEQFICPEDTLQIKCDFTDSDDRSGLMMLLEGSYEVDRLELVKASLTDLLPLDKKSMIGNIHTLVLRDMDISMEDLQEIADRFTNIACFDVKTCSIKGDIEPMYKTHIVLSQEPGRRIGHHNIQEQYNDLNAHLKEFVQSYTYKGFGKKLYEGDVLKICRHPAAPFIRTVAFLKSTELRDNHFRDLRKSLKDFFPNMILLDLSGCTNLCVDTLEYINYFGVQEVYLKGCHHIMYRRLPSKHPETLQVIQSPEGRKIKAEGGKETSIRLEVEEVGSTQKVTKEYRTDGTRVYEFVPKGFTARIMHLYLNEVENIRLDGVRGVREIRDMGIGAAMSVMEQRLKTHVRLSYFDPLKEGEDDTTSTYSFEHKAALGDASPQRVRRRNRNKSPTRL